MRTWGYIKDATLAKLDIEEDEANVLKMISRFYIYANEAMTQISSLKPRRSFITLIAVETIDELDPNDKSIVLIGSSIDIRPIIETDNFKGFDTSRWYFKPTIKDHNGKRYGKEVEMFKQCRIDGDNSITLIVPGVYRIPILERWFNFSPSLIEGEDESKLDDDSIIDAPFDVIDAIPSYIASQIYKIDNEAKSAIFRNEYEIFLSRIDVRDLRDQDTMDITGGW